MKRWALAIALVALVPGLATACSSDGGDATEAVREIFDEYEASVLNGDADRWIALWTDNPIALWPGVPAVSGTATMADAIRADFDAFLYNDFTILVDEVETSGDWAYAVGTFSAAYEFKEGGEQGALDGKYLTVFNKSDGTWKIHRDISNYNAP
jgi:uncharacterized protein (TIGR02246 family)